MPGSQSGLKYIALALQSSITPAPYLEQGHPVYLPNQTDDSSLRSLLGRQPRLGRSYRIHYPLKLEPIASLVSSGWRDRIV